MIHVVPIDTSVDSLEHCFSFFWLIFVEVIPCWSAYSKPPDARLTGCLWDQEESDSHQSDEEELRVNGRQITFLTNSDLQCYGSGESSHPEPKVIGSNKGTWQLALLWHCDLPRSICGLRVSTASKLCWQTYAISLMYTGIPVCTMPVPQPANSRATSQTGFVFATISKTTPRVRMMVRRARLNFLPK